MMSFLHEMLLPVKTWPHHRLFCHATHSLRNIKYCILTTKRLSFEIYNLTPGLKLLRRQNIHAILIFPLKVQILSIMLAYACYAPPCSVLICLLNCVNTMKTSSTMKSDLWTSFEPTVINCTQEPHGGWASMSSPLTSCQHSNQKHIGSVKYQAHLGTSPGHPDWKKHKTNILKHDSPCLRFFRATQCMFASSEILTATICQ